MITILWGQGTGEKKLKANKFNLKVYMHMTRQCKAKWFGGK